MKTHNDLHSWSNLFELLQSWWRGDTSLGAAIMSIAMVGLHIAHFGGGDGWRRKTLEILPCGVLALTFASAFEHVGWPKSFSATIGGGTRLTSADAIREVATRVIDNRLGGSKR